MTKLAPEASGEDQEEEARRRAEALLRLGQPGDGGAFAGVTAGSDGSHYRDAWHLAPDPMFTTDVEGGVRNLNAAGIELLGDVAAGVTLESLVHEEDGARIRLLLACAASKPERSRVRFRTRTGRSARCGLRAARSSDGLVVLWMARIERGTGVETAPGGRTDSTPDPRLAAQIADLTRNLAISERKTIAERMARENAEGRERDLHWTMLIVAHGLLLPIEHIQHWCGRLREANDPAARKLAADIISRHLKLQAELAQDLLDVSRVAEGRLRTGFAPVDAEGVTALVAATFEPLAADKGVVVESRARELGHLQGDSVRLAQALSNLVWAALQLSDPGRTVTIGGERGPDTMSLSVAWQGKPLRPDQIDWDLTRLGEGGSGSDRVRMSFLIARQLLQLHGGRLRAAPSEEGNAVVATFSLRAGSLPPATPRRA